MLLYCRFKMVFTADDKQLIKCLRQLKGYSSRKLFSRIYREIGHVEDFDCFLSWDGRKSSAQCTNRALYAWLTMPIPVRCWCSLCEKCQRQSCRAFIGLTNRAKIIGKGRPLLPEISAACLSVCESLCDSVCVCFCLSVCVCLCVYVSVSDSLR